MKNNYLTAGAVIILLLVGLFIFRSDGEDKKIKVEDELTSVSTFSHSHGLAVDVLDGSNVYIATHEGLYLLKDDKDLFRIGKTKDDLMGFIVHPTEAKTFFSSGHPSFGGNIGFQSTMDGGITWKKISAGLAGPVDFHAIAVSNANPSVIYGFFRGKLQRSSDGGKSWEYAEGTIAPIALSTHPVDEKVVYAATQNGVEVSKDSGENWGSISKELEGGMVSVFALDPTDEKYALAFSQKLGGLGKSTDGGVTWQSVPEKFGGGTLMYLSYSGAESGVVYTITHDNSLYKSVDRGNTWVKIR